MKEKIKVKKTERNKTLKKFSFFFRLFQSDVDVIQIFLWFQVLEPITTAGILKRLLISADVWFFALALRLFLEKKKKKRFFRQTSKKKKWPFFFAFCFTASFWGTNRWCILYRNLLFSFPSISRGFKKAHIKDATVDGVNFETDKCCLLFFLTLSGSRKREEKKVQKNLLCWIPYRIGEKENFYKA